jgi:5-amino-6-(5-phosphoribosylamino)uracil reductase
MTERPYVVISCAVSLDGYLDDASDARLVLSNDEDFDHVDEVRAGVDAILVGANTVRRDNPRLLIRAPHRRAARRSRGLPEHPLKVTITSTGDLDPSARFFAEGSSPRLVYTSGTAAGPLRKRLAGKATVVDADGLAALLGDLAARGVGRLLVEGGGTILTQLLAGGLADEMRLAIAPLLVGDSAAPRFVHDGQFGAARMSLAEVRQLGDLAVLRYVITGQDAGG